LQFEIIQHAVVDSTSERAFDSIASGRARHGDVHVADGQTRGRGRLGRAWFSPRGEGLYMSVVLLPPPPPWNAPALTIACGLAVFDAVMKLGVESISLKWPNDLMHAGCKLAGVLVETRGLEPDHPHYVVGIGLNVGQRSFPPELDAERRPTSLALLGLSTTIDHAMQQVLRELSGRVEQIDSAPRRLAEEYVRAAHLDRDLVRVHVGEEELDGEVIDLALEEGLLLKCRGGGERRLSLSVIRGIERA
jgi:BirA family transcriptional regulator, biotin operon repressor / biotin---[acetyl-CoA-carboxylase] ligase